jgi:hypothetical protein
MWRSEMLTAYRDSVVAVPADDRLGFGVGAPSALNLGGEIALAMRVWDPRGTAVTISSLTPTGTWTEPFRQEPRWELRKSDVVEHNVPEGQTPARGALSMGRACLRRGPGGSFLLYVSWRQPGDGEWVIGVLTADELSGFRVSAMRTIVTASELGLASVRDPWIQVHGDGRQTLWYAGQEMPGGPTTTRALESADGAMTWQRTRRVIDGLGYEVRSVMLGSIVDGAGPAEGRALAFLSVIDTDGHERTWMAISSDHYSSWKVVTVVPPQWHYPLGVPSLRTPYVTASPWGDGVLRCVDVISSQGLLSMLYECTGPCDGRRILVRRLAGQAFNEFLAVMD